MKIKKSQKGRELLAEGKRKRKMKKVSVIVPCYNAARYLDKCMDQLIHQTIGIDNLEIILVDDASTDEGETAKLLQRYERRFSETIKVIFLEKNLRQGGARNMGVSYAEGEYIAFCDADDWLLEETLEHVYQIAKDYDADMVSFARKYVNVRENPVSLEKGDRNRLFELDTLEKRKAFLLNMQEEDYSSQNKLFRSSLIREYQIAFVAHFCMEEASFTIPARLYAKRSFYLDEKLYICYLSPGSTMRSDDWENKKWDNLQVWMIMMEELQARGAFPLFQQEIEYLFFTQGIGWSLQFLFQRGGTLTKEEWKVFVKIAKKMLFSIRENHYVKNEGYSFNQIWNDLLLVLLDLEFTDENVEIANQAMMKCAQAISTCPAFC